MESPKLLACVVIASCKIVYDICSFAILGYIMSSTDKKIVDLSASLTWYWHAIALLIDFTICVIMIIGIIQRRPMFMWPFMFSQLLSASLAFFALIVTIVVTGFNIGVFALIIIFVISILILCISYLAYKEISNPVNPTS